MRIARHRRRGFTLIELIVVIGIIVLLIGLTLGAVFRLRDAQLEKNSNEAVRQIQIGFDQQWKAAGDSIRNQKPVPQPIMELTRTANGSYDSTRANALHMKLRLRQEFPQTFGEADRARFAAVYPNVPPQYAPKLVFSTAVAGSANTDANLEAAVLLYLIISQGQGGITFDPEKVGGVKAVNIGSVSHKVFTDSWGNPISFRRWADMQDNPEVVAELSLPPHASPGKYPDRQDPEGRLGFDQAPNWMTAGTVSNRQVALDLFIARGAFRPAFQQSTPPLPTDINPFDGMNRGPFVFSAGKDGQYMTADDLYGFRLQQQGKGN